jgi:hypothetical protein
MIAGQAYNPVENKILNLTSYKFASAPSTGTSADGFGTWVQALASVGSRNVILRSVNIRLNATTHQFFEAEIGIGGSGSEARIFGILGSNSTAAHQVNYPVWRVIPANSRIAVRARDPVTTANACQVTLDYFEDRYNARIPEQRYGLVRFRHKADILNNYATASTNVTSHTSDDTFGNWTQLIANVGTRDILVLLLGVGNYTGQSGNVHAELELGIGANPNEAAIHRLYQSTLGSATTLRPTLWEYPYLRIPAGSAVSARVRTATAAANYHYRVFINYIQI